MVRAITAVLLSAALLLASSLAIASFTIVAPTAQPIGGPTQSLLINASITSSSDIEVTNLSSNKVTLIYNILTATSGTLTFTIAEADPQNPTTTLTGGQTASTAALAAAGTGQVTISGITSSAVKVSWVAAGGPSFAGVYLSLAARSASSSGGGGITNPYKGTFIADAGVFDMVTVDGTGANNDALLVNGAWAITGAGHEIPLSPSPSTPGAGSFAGGYQATGAVNTISLNGSDRSFQVAFTTGTSTAAIPAGTVLLIVTLAGTYSSGQVNCFFTMQSGIDAGADAFTPVCGIPAGSTLVLKNANAFNPGDHTPYVYGFETIGAGATF